MERRCTRVHNNRMWINGYEYGLFMTPNDATVMGETLHVHGFIMDDVVSSFMYDLALSLWSCRKCFVHAKVGVECASVERYSETSRCSHIVITRIRCEWLRICYFT